MLNDKSQEKHLFWIIGEKYPATEILESLGVSVEAHQRWRDEQLNKHFKNLELVKHMPIFESVVTAVVCELQQDIVNEWKENCLNTLK